MKFPLLILYYIIVFLICSNALQCQDIDSFDSNQLKDTEPNWPLIIEPAAGDTSSLAMNATDDTSLIIVNGYRVQVLATRYLDKADSLKIKLEDRINETVYIPFEAPNYKVRIGNFTDRNKAEEMQVKLKKLGYGSAWIIRTHVEVKSNHRRL